MTCGNGMTACSTSPSIAARLGANGADAGDRARVRRRRHDRGVRSRVPLLSWRPYRAIQRAGEDGNPATDPDPTWAPLRTTPNHPKYPAAHAFHSSAVATALAAFFGTDKIAFTLDSRVPGATPTREYP